MDLAASSFSECQCSETANTYIYTSILADLSNEGCSGMLVNHGTHTCSCSSDDSNTALDVVHPRDHLGRTHLYFNRDAKAHSLIMSILKLDRDTSTKFPHTFADQGALLNSGVAALGGGTSLRITNALGEVKRGYCPLVTLLAATDDGGG